MIMTKEEINKNVHQNGFTSKSDRIFFVDTLFVQQKALQLHLLEELYVFISPFYYSIK